MGSMWLDLQNWNNFDPSYKIDINRKSKSILEALE